MKKCIEIKNCAQNNLKNVSVKIPLGQMTVICGLSGSGKSSLAFETLFAEGQRRYLESLSNYVKQYVSRQKKPLAESIKNLPPALALEQKNNVRSSRSLTATASGLADHLRLLFTHAGTAVCEKHRTPLQSFSPVQAADFLIKNFSGEKILIAAPVKKNRAVLSIGEGGGEDGGESANDVSDRPDKRGSRSQSANGSAAKSYEKSLAAPDRRDFFAARDNFLLKLLRRKGFSRLLVPSPLAEENPLAEKSPEGGAPAADSRAADASAAEKSPEGGGKGGKSTTRSKAPHSKEARDRDARGGGGAGGGSTGDSPSGKASPPKAAKGAWQIQRIEDLKRLPERDFFILIDRLVIGKKEKGRLTDSIEQAFSFFLPAPENSGQTGAGPNLAGPHRGGPNLGGPHRGGPRRAVPKGADGAGAVTTGAVARRAVQTGAVITGCGSMTQGSSASAAGAATAPTALPAGGFSAAGTAPEEGFSSKGAAAVVFASALSKNSANKATDSVQTGSGQTGAVATGAVQTGAVQTGRGKTGPAANPKHANMLWLSSQKSGPCCPYCRFRLPVPVTPALFSFNSPLGACPSCKGAGEKPKADKNKILKPHRTIGSGALFIFENLQAMFLHKSLIQFCEENGVPLNKPYHSLEEKHKHQLWHGHGDWTGVEPYLEYLEAGAERKASFRNHLARFQSPAPCPDCRGARLRKEASLIFLKDKSFNDIMKMSLKKAETFFNSFSKENASAARTSPVKKIPEGGASDGDAGGSGAKTPSRDARSSIEKTPEGGIEKTPERDSIPAEKSPEGGGAFEELLSRITQKIRSLNELGLSYLSLNRPVSTLSGGEFQRMNLASRIGMGFSQMLYVLDEPTVGLHPRDTERMLQALKRLKDLGNTLVVVEHDQDVIERGDFIIEMGPGAGERGGEAVWSGSAEDFRKAGFRQTRSGQTVLRQAGGLKSGSGAGGSFTGSGPGGSGPGGSGRGSKPGGAGKTAVPFSNTAWRLFGDGTLRRSQSNSAERQASVSRKSKKNRAGGAPQSGPFPKRPVDLKSYKYLLTLKNCSGRNLKNIDLRLPLNRFVAVTGVSGSGKSSLMTDTLYPALLRDLKQAGQGKRSAGKPKESLPFRSMEGGSFLQNVLLLNQSDLSSSQRSSIASYMDIYPLIRNLFAAAPDAVKQDLSPSHFSFNTDKGRCPECKGLGFQEIDMVFMDPISVVCEECQGRKFKENILSVSYRGKNIYEVLNLTVEEARPFFRAEAPVLKGLGALSETGLSYLSLGRSFAGLSGGERQRLKLARELLQADRSKTLYILDEPTKGLHIQEVWDLEGVLQNLVESGGTVVVIEHNLEIIRAADFIIDIGPEGGGAGGRIVAEGPPETIASKAAGASFTAKALSRLLKKNPA